MKYIPFAVAATLAAAASSATAQSSVTVYGQVDAGVQMEKNPTGNIYRVVSGGRSASRLGFRGNEDLGGGLNALFVLEQGINADVGTLGQGGRAFGRQAYVGLRGAWGTVAAGRIATFGAGTGGFDMLGPIDPFSTAWGISGMGTTMSTATGLRVDNAVVYQSQDMNGFQFGALHSLQINGNETSPRSANVHLTGFGAKYANGPFFAATTYETANNPKGGKETHLQMGATYDFKVVMLHAAYARETGQFTTDLNVSGTTNGADATAYMVGASVPLAGGVIRASYQSRNGSVVGMENRDYDVVSLGYEYFFSKRTSLYGAVGDLNGKGSLSTATAFNRRTITAGLLHKF